MELMELRKKIIFYLQAARLPIVLALIFVLQNQIFIVWLKIVPHLYLVRGSLVAFALGIFLYGPAIFLGPRGRYWYLAPVSAVISLLFLAEYIYYSYFSGFMQASALAYAGHAFAVTGAIAALLTPELSFFALNFFLVFLAATLAYSKKLQPIILMKKEKIAAAFAILIIVAGGYGWLLHAEKRDWGSLLRLYSKIYDMNMLVGKIGIVNYFIEDAVKLARRNREVAPEDKVFVENWFLNRLASQNPGKITPQSKRNFGIAKGRNLILIQVESLENTVINTKINDQEITPNLNALIKEGLYFNNYFTQTAQGNTSDAEFAMLTSLYPLPDSVPFLDYAKNHFTALPQLLAEHGYQTYGFHGNVATFWNRANAYPNLGYRGWFAEKDFVISQSIGYKELGDEDFFRQSVPKLAALEQPFAATLLTLTSHNPFKLPPELQFLSLPQESGLNEVQQQYLQSIHYVDRAIGEFIAQLKQAGLYDNSLIAILGDHGSHIDIHKVLETGSVSADFKDCQVPLIILAPKTRLKGTINTLASHLDFYPTIARLLGIEPPISALGQDILNTDTPAVIRRIAITGNIRSILSPRLIYFAAADGVFEKGVCLQAPSRKPLPMAECRYLYDEQASLVRVSDTLVKGDLIPDVNGEYRNMKK